MMPQLCISTFLPLFVVIVILHLFTRFRRDSPIFLALSTHPASSLPLPPRARDHSLTHETLIVGPVRLAHGASSGLVDSEEFFNANVM